MSADGDWKLLISSRALHNQIHSNAKCKNRIDNNQCFEQTNLLVYRVGQAVLKWLFT